ncbi:HlyD family secretion protein [Parvicella tangerina]|uniref:HlyD family efflux transporter periplasmic adaptor subunit n=1 Tax=Parvicella tangerina TaxID=2829795 RepID=A0A916N9D9_9FLAO|nr:HlyD family efflux transporter periplasmic adaptor subunit [Parvicella tangerina]CAG5078771.1 hypothetical protein CRYO30217_00762 [Parvicella tangerina]
MLNISNNSRVGKDVRALNYQSLKRVESKVSGKVFKKIAISTLVVLLVLMFIPWTQNIRSNGKVITLTPDQRPQTVNSSIAGTVDKWYVKEGDVVQKGDTILHLKEIKSEYLDPNLVANTAQQKAYKLDAVSNYKLKVEALQEQLVAQEKEALLKYNQAQIKIQQAELKVQSDSIAAISAKLNLKTIEDQYVRFEDLQKEGLKSQTDKENRDMKLQNAKAYEIEATNKLLNSQSELINAKVDLSAVQTKYQTLIAKTKSDLSSANSNLLDAQIEYQKLDNKLSNYSIRNDMYYILAPQDGYVTQTLVKGVGETIKDGEAVVTIMPEKYEYAVEIYVDPIDLPLVNIGQHVRIQFDGWPAIVFSGWPNTSYGTYGGEVYAVDKFISENGKYRVLVKPEESDHPWPNQLRFGSGTRSFIMLKDVPIWYELWRNINGFPPEYYQVESAPKAKK